MSANVKPALSELFSAVPASVPTWEIYKREAGGPVVRVCAVGDIGFSGQVAREAERTGYAERFAAVAPFLKKADLVFGNLETPLLIGRTDGRQFAGDVQAAGALSAAGVSIVNLANNHIYDHGAAGLRSTMDACLASGLRLLGAGADAAAARDLLRTDVHDVKIGWLGCGRTLKPQSDSGPNYWEFDEGQVLAAIAQTRPLVDVLILSIHAGLMYLDYPDPKHKAFAEEALQQGADLILMHHAHVLQGVEIRDGKAVCFNLGNFLLDTKEGYVEGKSAQQEQSESAVFFFELDRLGVSSVRVIPTALSADLRVRWAEGEQGLSIIERLKKISSALDGDYSQAFLSQRADRNMSHSLGVLWFHLRHGNVSILREYIRSFRWSHLSLLARLLWSKLPGRGPREMR